MPSRPAGRGRRQIIAVGSASRWHVEICRAGEHLLQGDCRRDEPVRDDGPAAGFVPSGVNLQPRNAIRSRPATNKDIGGLSGSASAEEALTVTIMIWAPCGRWCD